MAKFDQLSGLLRKRIHRGDYVIRELPAERRLAEDHGVSYMTARRAVQELIDDGLLTRGANGRLKVKRAKTPRRFLLQTAFLLPSFESPAIERWGKVLKTEIEKLHGNLRQVVYTHWDDPVIGDVLDSFDGVFLLASTEAIPAAIREQFRESDSALVMLNEDLSHLGIPSIQLFPPIFEQRLLDHLAARGYRDIYCLNVQPCVLEVKQRIEQWQIWMAAHGYTGLLLNEPVDPYDEPFTRAYEVMQHLIAQGNLKADALFCVTIAGALGAMRAMHEAGIRPGDDVAICAVDGEGLAAFQIPSVTALEAPDAAPFVRHCLQWMARFHQDKSWHGPFLMQPAEVPLMVRESTPGKLAHQEKLQ